MVVSRSRRAAATAMAVVAVAAGVVVPTSAASADLTMVDGMPTQEQTDRASTDPGNTSNQAGWADMPGGVAARPYVRALSITNGDGTTDVVTDGGPTGPAVSPGDVTTVVSPVNLCRADQMPASGACYATPNRVALNLVYNAGDVNGYDFSRPAVPVTPAVNADSVIDMTIALNTLGRTLRWTWVSGHLLYWRVTDLGQDTATVRVRFRPAWEPWVPYEQWPAGNGCSATPIFDCDLPRATAEMLRASVLFSLDRTLDPALTGAVFATGNAMFGYLRPGGSATVPTMDIQAASTHLRSDGSPQLGTLQAFIPAGALLNLYGVLPSDAASLFAVRRTGDPGTNDRPTYQTWTAGVEGSDGLLVTVGNISFSVPRYRVATALARTPSHAKVRRGVTTVRATITACKRAKPCLVSVYRLNAPASARYRADRTAIVTGRTVVGKALDLRTTRLAKRDRYLLVVRSAKTGRTVVSTLGRVA